MRGAAITCFALVLSTLAASAQALEGRLETIKSTKIVKIAYRADSRPFSFVNAQGKPDGYTIDLCKLVVRSLERQLGTDLTVEWVRADTATRFILVANGTTDMECGSSTVTLARMKEVDFSSVIFVESTGVVVKASAGINSFNALAGKKIAVVAGTTNERAIVDQIKRRQLDIGVVQAKDRESGFSELMSGQVDGLASDKLLLMAELDRFQGLTVLYEDLSFEPYAIVLPRGDWSFRLAVNTALAHIYRRGDNLYVFNTWFSKMGLKVGLLLGAAFIFGNLPD